MTRALASAGVTAITTLTLIWSVGAVPAFATFLRTASATATAYGSSTLAPPASASATCASGTSNSTATINWGPSPSTYTTGYSITSTPISSTKTTVAGTTTTTLTGLTKGANYTFKVVATYRNWTSTARVTASVAC